MRLIIIVGMLGAVLFLPSASSAETPQECKTKCAADKVERDNNCPPATVSETARLKCLQDSSKEYQSCTNSCPKK